MPGSEASRSTDECPECGQQGYENPVLEDEYQCNNCVLAFNADGEVTGRE